MRTNGRYFRSKREAENAGYNVSEAVLKHRASIHYTGSVIGIRKLSWGYECDVARIGSYIYNLNSYVE